MPDLNKVTGEPTIIINLAEYKILVKANAMLDALYLCGVNNWEGYTQAEEEFKNNYIEED